MNKTYSFIAYTGALLKKHFMPLLLVLLTIFFLSAFRSFWLYEDSIEYLLRLDIPGAHLERHILYLQSLRMLHQGLALGLPAISFYDCSFIFNIFFACILILNIFYFSRNVFRQQLPAFFWTLIPIVSLGTTYASAQTMPHIISASLLLCLLNITLFNKKITVGPVFLLMTLAALFHIASIVQVIPFFYIAWARFKKEGVLLYCKSYALAIMALILFTSSLFYSVAIIRMPLSWTNYLFEPHQCWGFAHNFSATGITSLTQNGTHYLAGEIPFMIQQAYLLGSCSLLALFFIVLHLLYTHLLRKEKNTSLYPLIAFVLLFNLLFALWWDPYSMAFYIFSGILSILFLIALAQTVSTRLFKNKKQTPLFLTVCGLLVTLLLYKLNAPALQQEHTALSPKYLAAQQATRLAANPAAYYYVHFGIMQTLKYFFHIPSAHAYDINNLLKENYLNTPHCFKKKSYQENTPALFQLALVLPTNAVTGVNLPLQTNGYRMPHEYERFLFWVFDITNTRQGVTARQFRIATGLPASWLNSWIIVYPKYTTYPSLLALYAELDVHIKPAQPQDSFIYWYNATQKPKTVSRIP